MDTGFRFFRGTPLVEALDRGSALQLGKSLVDQIEADVRRPIIASRLAADALSSAIWIAFAATSASSRRAFLGDAPPPRADNGLGSQTPSQP